MPFFRVTPPPDPRGTQMNGIVCRCLRMVRRQNLPVSNRIKESDSVCVQIGKSRPSFEAHSHSLSLKVPATLVVWVNRWVACYTRWNKKWYPNDECEVVTMELLSIGVEGTHIGESDFRVHVSGDCYAHLVLPIELTLMMSGKWVLV